MKITVILLSYKRVQNLSKIIDSIKSQTVDTKLIVWNNNPDLNLSWEVDYPNVDLLVNSDENKFCNIRWELAKAADTEYVLIIDDDLYFADTTILEYIVTTSIASYQKNRLFGVEGVMLDENLGYFDVSGKRKIILHKEVPVGQDQPVHFAKPHENIAVDVVKGRLILMKKDDLNALDTLPTKYIDKADDITYSLWMANEKRSHLLIGGCDGRIIDFENKNDENSLSSITDWKNYRNEAVSYLTETKYKIHGEDIYDKYHVKDEIALSMPK